MAKADARKRFGALMALQGRLERSMRETAKPGFEPNWFGSFDRADLTSDLLSGFEALVESDPGEHHFRYLFAGALARALRLDEAHSMYAGLVDAIPSAQVMLAMVELAQGNRDAAERTLADYNARCVQRGTPFMQTSIEKISMSRTQAP